MSDLLFRPSVLRDRDRLDEVASSPHVVTPAKAGVQSTLERLDSRLRGNDKEWLFPAYYEPGKICEG
jgi:hypothetical protein